MFTAPPPVVVQQKRGMGCFGIGCVILVVALILVGGLIAILSYFFHSNVTAMTSPAPATPQAHDAGDNVYQAAEDKLSTFQQAQEQSRPASIELTADEINTLIARDPDFANNQIHAQVSMTGNRMRIEASFPTNLIPMGMMKDRYVNGVAEFSPHFNPATKDLSFHIYALRFGSESIPESQLGTLETNLNPFINTQLHLAPNTQGLLDHAQAIEVRDGKLEIEMR